MNRFYDTENLESIFGYDIGYYGRYYNKYKKLAPNIAIYAKTPILINNHFKTIHVINLIGYAFDNKSQPDYKYFNSIYNIFDINMDNKIDILKKYYTKMWKYAFICAQLKELNTIHISSVGGGAFKPYDISNLEFKELILIPSINNAKEQIDINNKININWDIFPDFIVPDSFKYKLQSELNNTLYVNAWDCWSMVGNGNEYDNSLDGYYGRSTALSVLCWPLSNPYIQYHSCNI